MKKFMSILASAILTASVFPVISASADYYELKYDSEVHDCTYWEEMTDYFAIEGTKFALDSKHETLFAVIENEDVSLSGRAVVMSPNVYHGTEEETNAVVDYLKKAHPEVKVYLNRYNSAYDAFQLELYRSDFIHEMQVAKDIKENLGIELSYFLGDEVFSAALHEGEPEKISDGLEKLRAISFDRLLEMTEEDICAISPETELLYAETKRSIFTSVNSTRPLIDLKDMTNMIDPYDDLHGVTDEFSDMIGVPKTYIKCVEKANYTAVTSYGKGCEGVRAVFDPTQNTAFEPWYVQLRINMKLAACDSPNIYNYHFDQPGGGSPEFLLMGDINGDLSVTIADSAALLQYLGNKDKYPLSQTALSRADCFNSGDGITTSDAVTIQKYVTGIIPTLPENSPQTASSDKNSASVTISVVDENGELLKEKMSFSLLSSQKNMPEGAGGVCHVKSWKTSEENPVTITDLETQDMVYTIQYSSVNVDGYSIAINEKENELSFDFEDGLKKDIVIQVTKIPL